MTPNFCSLNVSAKGEYPTESLCASVHGVWASNKIGYLEFQ